MAPSPRRFLHPDTCLVNNCNGLCWASFCLTPPPSPSPDSVTVAVHHGNKLLPSFLIAAASLLALFCLLLILFYSLLRLRRRNRRLLHAQQQQQDQAPPPRADDLFLGVGDDRDGGGPHHVWFIRTVGLDESVIKSIAAAVYKSGDGLIDGGDCTVCLGEFRDGEVIKLLPKCAHAFHVSCIDTWLRSHDNCPLCRSPVVAPAAVVPAEEAVGSGSGHSEDTHIESRNQEERAVVIYSAAGSSSSSGPPEEDEVQPIRRSVSMDSSSLGRIMLRADLVSGDKLGEERKELELRGVVIPKKAEIGVDCAGKQSAAVEMKRSLSSRSGRFFFSRCGRGRSDSILPL